MDCVASLQVFAKFTITEDETNNRTAQTNEINDLADTLRSNFFLLVITFLSANFLTSDTINIEDVSATRKAISEENNFYQKNL